MHHRIYSTIEDALSEPKIPGIKTAGLRYATATDFGSAYSHRTWNRQSPAADFESIVASAISGEQITRSRNRSK
jgi:hypothetical protein